MDSPVADCCNGKVDSFPLPLSVLDLFPVGPGLAPSEVIRRSVDIARQAEELGFVRYWVAEHHNMPGIATSAPEVLIAHVASATRTIRVGAGGMMVPNHAPLHLIEVFRTLEALHPGRIDLGLGRAPGTDPVASAALHPSPEHDVDQRLAELFAFERGGFPPDHPFRRITPMPSDVALPPIWMLGSTLAGARIAASHSLRYAFAGHFAMRYARQAIAHYYAHFRPSASLAEPEAILAVTVVCGEDDDHARRLAAPLKLAVVRIRTGKAAPLASIEEALAYRFTPEEEAIAEDFLHGAAIGGPSRVRARIQELVDETGADEIMLSTMIADTEERMASYRRVAEAFKAAAAPRPTI
jgi:luciferase family oxidoreductase group 1